MTSFQKLVVLASTFAAITMVADAAVRHENDAMAIATAKVSLTQAVTTAEQSAHGQAARAEYENSHLGWVYDVEVVSGNKVYDIKVDAASSKVVASKLDQADHDDDHDRQD